MLMKNCKKCGGKNSDNEVYCDYCGSLLPCEEKVSFFDFLNETQYIFAIWGVFGAFSLYLLDFLGKFSDKEVELLKVIQNSTASQSQLYHFIANNIGTSLFSVTTAASFIIFLLISFAILEKWRTYFEIIYTKSIESKKIGTNYIIFIAFITFFYVVVIGIGAFTVIKFLYVLVQLEYLLIIMIVLYGGLAYLNIRSIKAISDAKADKKNPDMTPEEIAKKTMAFQAFQLGIIVTVSFAAFIGTFLKEYGPVWALIGGGVGGITAALIALRQIKKLGF